MAYLIRCRLGRTPTTTRTRRARRCASPSSTRVTTARCGPTRRRGGGTRVRSSVRWMLRLACHLSSQHRRSARRATGRALRSTRGRAAARWQRRRSMPSRSRRCCSGRGVRSCARQPRCRARTGGPRRTGCPLMMLCMPPPPLTPPWPPAPPLAPLLAPPEAACPCTVHPSEKARCSTGPSAMRCAWPEMRCARSCGAQAALGSSSGRSVGARRRRCSCTGTVTSSSAA